MTAAPPRPLASIGVLDFSTLIPGPFATMVLADLGARVVRIEAPHRADAVRELPPGAGSGGSAWHAVLGRSKRSICLDLKNPASRDVVQRLLDSHDVLVEQMRPGVMERLGYGYDDLKPLCPRLVYCSINSFGGDGPARDRAAHDINALALAGVLATGGGWGAEERAWAAPPGIQVADLAAAMNAVAGILAAVIERAETGVGRRVETSLYESALMWNLLAASEVLSGAGPAAAGDGLLNGGSRYGVYETADGRHLALGGLEPAIWERFCEAAGRPDLHDQPLAAREPDLKREIAALVRGRTLSDWIAALDGVDGCAEPVLTVAEAVEQAERIAPHMIVEVDAGNPGGGTCLTRPDAQRQVGSAIRFGGSALAPRRAGVEPGADRDEILAEIGYTVDEVEELAAAGAFGQG